MRQIIISSIVFLCLQFGLLAQGLNIGAVEIAIPFSVAGFQVCESYPLAKQKKVLKDFKVYEIDTEFGLSHSFVLEEENGSVSDFYFRAEECREFTIETKRFALNMGKVQLRVGDHKDKLKGVPNLTLVQAMDFSEPRNPKPIPGKWHLKHPNILEDVVLISIFIENDIITGFHGICML